MLPKSLCKTIINISIDAKKKILKKSLLKLFLTIYPDNHIKNNNLDTSDTCKVKKPRLIHLVAPFTVTPTPGIWTSKDKSKDNNKKNWP